ncbi:MAG: sigma-70 family RNA polymerase sigma factor [Clostridiaceae bacterium]|nr:sigma-70 family RNA polymerase sigma factor [Clostridiaceae bacterium]
MTQQYVIYKKFYLNYPESHIANQLNVSRQAVNSMKKRAIAKLKILMTEQ